MAAMPAWHKARRHGNAAMDREFEKLLRRTAALQQDRKRPRSLKAVRKKRATAA